MQQGSDYLKKFLEKHIDLLKKIPLFEGIKSNELEEMLECLGVVDKTYPKDSIIFSVGSEVTSIGIMLKGSAHIIKEDIEGNRNIVAELLPGDLFGEVFACTRLHKSNVTVTTTSSCEVLFIKFKSVTGICSSTCVFHNRLVENMLQLIAEKNILLHNKIELLSRKTTREKLLMYFSKQIEQTGSHKFTIPFSRNEMADFLCVDRSSMSRELGKMRDEGLLSFNKNKFEIFCFRNKLNI
ncbi:TPA: Crp/Fnr family transcriptional regulator [Clostridioides difficile]|nr:Crp/Fnr family transcriptional regulator [Clostridioides difficile]HBE9107697.1 Crp/Fnr family transcriptional regulator [Clostridioides difficile]HBF4440553.1 Crp/Fnr family transcriptional regulator [Clostridioides difficile]HBF4444600.1 Crp/Fnr family transcriptional regulator [Clostridioides difficile]